MCVCLSTDKKVSDMDVENRATRKHMKRLRTKMNGTCMVKPL